MKERPSYFEAIREAVAKRWEQSNFTLRATGWCMTLGLEPNAVIPVCMQGELIHAV